MEGICSARLEQLAAAGSGDFMICCDCPRRRTSGGMIVLSNFDVL